MVGSAGVVESGVSVGSGMSVGTTAVGLGGGVSVGRGVSVGTTAVGLGGGVSVGKDVWVGDGDGVKMAVAANGAEVA